MGSGLSSAASRAPPSPTGPAAPSSEEVAALQSQLAATKAESSKLAQQVARLEQEFAASSASTPHRTDSEAKLVQMENDVFSKTLDTLSAEVARLKADNDKLRDSVKEKQTDLSRSLAEANSLAAQLRLVQQQRGGAADVGVENRRASAALLDGQLFSFKLGERDVAKLRQIQRRTNFHEVSIDRIFDVFRQHAEGGCLDRKRFHAAVAEIAAVPPSHRFVFDRLYTLFDRDGDEKVDFGEFAGGLSVLCAGSREEKLKLVFAFVDADGNGSLSKAELMGFFTTLLVVTQGLRDGTTLTAEQISLLEAQTSSEIESCFAQIDKDHDGKLDFDEFRSGVEGSQSQLQSLLEIFTFTATSGSADAPDHSCCTACTTSTPVSLLTTPMMVIDMDSEMN